ncbi:MAG: hypothetical protein NC124_13500 [Clostridium sp.]|nr:hypothetical protein [Clostridium sp.]
MDKLDVFLHSRQFAEVEKILLENLKKDTYNIDLLLKLAMIKWQFEEDDAAVEYLDRVIEIEPYNFHAICIKTYLRFYYYHEMPEIEKIEHHTWNSAYEMAVAYYIISWKYHYNDEKVHDEIKWLNKSIFMYPDLVYPYERLGYANERMQRYQDAVRCYRNAVKHVVSTEFFGTDYISAQAFIDEYITGIKMSSLNYDNLLEEFEEAEKRSEIYEDMR